MPWGQPGLAGQCPSECRRSCCPAIYLVPAVGGCVKVHQMRSMPKGLL